MTAGAGVEQVLQRRQGAADAAVVGDLAGASCGTLKSTRTRTRLPCRSAGRRGSSSP